MRRSTLIMTLSCLLPPTLLGICSAAPQPDVPEEGQKRLEVHTEALPQIPEPARPGSRPDLMPDTVSGFGRVIEEVMEPGEIARPLRVRYLGLDYGRVFADKNDIHMPHAEAIGINRITSLRSYWQNTRGMEAVVSCRHYYVDNLTHSRAVLVPQAKRMLEEIGRRFADTLQVRGGGNYRIKVTSLTRTADDVRRLRRVNVNSISESTHFFGTTVDISYADFVRDPGSEPRTVDNLKGILSEVLYAMRNEGKCCVLFERKQHCFHVTVCSDYDNTSPQI